ncbi:MAG: selenium-dependent xanthine dehydrogenase [Actinomyces sp.]|nr:MAG: selenium-dependent xanthine dehydrogenase [Actinomyces sp.]
MTAPPTRFTCNGTSVAVGDHPHLLAALRDELGLVAAKDGCAPSGQCGCCTVLVDGRARVACQTPLERVADREVTTLEGLDDDTRRRFAAAFAAVGALQCGFCTPGIVLRAHALLERHGTALTRERLARHLGAHLCRCTGYLKILDAVELLARGDEPAPPTPATPVGIGTRLARYQGHELTLGDKPYVADMRPPGLLRGAVRLADHARADVVRIDTAAALALPGVHAVVTAADVPGELRVGLIDRDWPVFIPEGGRTSYLGDVIALAVADDEETARRAAAAVEVEYRPLRPITDPETACDDEDAVWGLDGNLLSVSAYTRGGDVDAALAASAHVVTERFVTQRVEQAFLEPESTLAVPTDEGGLLVYSGGQGVWDDRRQIAEVCALPESAVWVEQVANGGAFGGKEDLSNQAQTALAALVTGRPVLTTFSRTESLLVHAKRHPIRIDLEVGCDEQGRLTALRARLLGDSGPYASVGAKVLERAAGHACGPYVIPVVDVEARAVRTNNPVCGAFRGFGANQAQFAMEGAIDRLAAAVGLSGWEMRRRNVVEPGAVWGPGQVMDEGCRGARACLEAVRPAYEQARAAGRAVGLGLGLKNSGLGNGAVEVARAVVHFVPDAEHPPGTPAGPDTLVEVRHCWTEMGQGVHTVALQVACEELGVSPERVRVVVDTSRELGAGQTTGSRGTLMGAGAVAAACRAARADDCRTGIDHVGEYRVDWTHAFDDPSVANPVIHSTFGYAAQLVIADPDTGTIEQVVAAHDVGRAVNPLLCEGQIEGAVHMGLGYALGEEFPCDAEGRPLNTTLRSLGILRAADMPPVEVVLVESPQPDAPYGIKGVGEIGLVPTAPAVAAAWQAIDGRWRTRLPLGVHEPLRVGADPGAGIRDPGDERT